VVVHGGVGDAVGHQHFGGEALAGLGQQVGRVEQPGEFSTKISPQVNGTLIY
jgi:hypothetical protein